MTYPESWHRQTPKGYQPDIALLQDGEPIIVNDGLALKIFQEFCCESCVCQTESDHKKETTTSPTDN
jgi:hypothetical protein